MNTKILTALILGAALIIGGYFTLSSRNSPAPTNVAQQQPKTADSGESLPAENNGTKVQASEQGVLISNFSFNPKEIRIKAGTKVVWTNDDSAQHSVTGDGEVFDSQRLAQGQKFEFIFNDKGVFNYHCFVHPSMAGKVIVE